MDTRDLCLGILSLGEATGYDIKKRLEDTFGYFMEVSQSAVYPALAELLRRELVTVRRVEQEDRPDRKVYAITPAGREALEAALLRSPARHRSRSEFMVVLFFAAQVPPWRLRQIIDDHLEEMEHLIELAERWLADQAEGAPEGVRFVAGFAVATMRAGCQFIRANRHRLLETAGSNRLSATEAQPRPEVVR